MQKIIGSIKNNAILYISGLLALISCFIVKPDLQYVGYINFRVLAILFGLMLIVAALGHIGTFDILTNKLLARVRTYKSISLLMSLMAFFMSMFLTKDVSLVTLVPFAIMVLAPFGENRKLMFTLIIMTVAANLGSMLTPIGNPQNLYLYDHYKIPLPDFLLKHRPETPVYICWLEDGCGRRGDGGAKGVRTLHAIELSRTLGSGATDSLSIMTRYNAWLETRIGENPALWYGWTHRRFYSKSPEIYAQETPRKK